MILNQCEKSTPDDKSGFVNILLGFILEITELGISASRLRSSNRKSLSVANCYHTRFLHNVNNCRNIIGVSKTKSILRFSVETLFVHFFNTVFETRYIVQCRNKLQLL